MTGQRGTWMRRAMGGRGPRMRVPVEILAEAGPEALLVAIERPDGSREELQAPRAEVRARSG